MLVVPAAEPGLSGAAEDEAFAHLAPTPEHSAAIAQLVLTSLLPALVERDVEEFGAALTRVQQLVGDSFAAVQGGRFHPRASGLVGALLEAGAAGAGQSSWGPAVYGIAGSEAAARELAGRMAGEGGRRGRGVRQRRCSRGAPPLCLGARSPGGSPPRRNEGWGVMRLLVSVVDADEARAAAAAGADIVDVKNPAEGSLGAPSPAVIERVRAAVPPELPVSVAIGDMPNLPGTAALAALGAARSGASFVKVGLWGVSTEAEAVALLRAVREAAAGAVVVAGAYADARRVAHAPLAPELAAARRGRGRGGRCACSTRPSRTAAGSSTGSRRTSSRRWWPRRTTRACRSRWPARCAPRSCPAVRASGADIAGVRSAACRDGRRGADRPRPHRPAAPVRRCCRRVRATRHDSRAGGGAAFEQLREPLRVAPADHPRLEGRAPAASAGSRRRPAAAAPPARERSARPAARRAPATARTGRRPP